MSEKQTPWNVLVEKSAHGDEQVRKLLESIKEQAEMLPFLGGVLAGTKLLEHVGVAVQQEILNTFEVVVGLVVEYKDWEYSQPCESPTTGDSNV